MGGRGREGEGNRQNGTRNDPGMSGMAVPAEWAGFSERADGTARRKHVCF